MEAILLANKLVSEEQLQQTIRYAQAIGIDLYEAVLQKRIASPDDVMMAYAESIGLPFIRLADSAIDEDMIAHVDPIMVRQYSFIPVSRDQGYVLLATTKPVIPDVEEELRMIFNLPVRCAICSPAELSEAITKYFPRGTSPIIKSERKKISPPKQSVPQPKPVEPLNDEEKKNRLLVSIVAFNFSVAFVCFALYHLRFPWHQLPLFGIVVGVVVAFVVWKKLSR